MGFSCFEVRQGAWFSLRKIRNKQTNHSVLLHRCNPLSSSTGKNFCKLMYQTGHCERQRGNPVTSYPSLRAKRGNPVTSHPSLRASAWQSSDLTPVIASVSVAIHKNTLSSKTPEWRCSQIVIFLKVEETLAPKRLWGRFVI